MSTSSFLARLNKNTMATLSRNGGIYWKEKVRKRYPLPGTERSGVFHGSDACVRECVCVCAFERASMHVCERASVCGKY